MDFDLFSTVLYLTIWCRLFLYLSKLENANNYKTEAPVVKPKSGGEYVVGVYPEIPGPPPGTTVKSNMTQEEYDAEMERILKILQQQ